MPSTTSNQATGKLDALTLEDNERSTNPEEDLQLRLFQQVSEWLKNEKLRQNVLETRRAEADPKHRENFAADQRVSEESRTGSGNLLPLNKLEEILGQYSRSRGTDSLDALQSVNRTARRRPKGLRRGSASESDCADFEAPVPGVEAVLDNSKTLAYNSSVAADDDAVDSSTSSKRSKDREAWQVFRTEILRLAHTLQLRGWRKVPKEKANEIEVVRLSGALTNAVYVVQPPKNLPPPKSDSNSLVSRKPPP
jgi:choline kinase